MMSCTRGGDETYNFDHKDNRSHNNSQKNCFLVCRNCHGAATKTKVVRHYNPFTGEPDGHSTIKLKAGYKKTAKKPARKTTGRR